MANRVAFGEGVTVEHAPAEAYRPPASYTGVVTLVDGKLRLTVTPPGGSSVYVWDETDEEWEKPTLWRRIYYNDGTYEVWDNATLREAGTWTAVG